MSIIDAKLIMGYHQFHNLLVLLPRAAMMRRPPRCSCHHAPRLSSLPSGMHMSPAPLYMLLRCPSRETKIWHSLVGVPDALPRLASMAACRGWPGREDTSSPADRWRYGSEATGEWSHEPLGSLDLRRVRI